MYFEKIFLTTRYLVLFKIIRKEKKLKIIPPLEIAFLPEIALNIQDMVLFI